MRSRDVLEQVLDRAEGAHAFACVVQQAPIIRVVRLCGAEPARFHLRGQGAAAGGFEGAEMQVVRETSILVDGLGVEDVGLGGLGIRHAVVGMRVVEVDVRGVVHVRGRWDIELPRRAIDHDVRRRVDLDGLVEGGRRGGRRREDVSVSAIRVVFQRPANVVDVLGCVFAVEDVLQCMVR